jgi:hypothetical protein
MQSNEDLIRELEQFRQALDTGLERINLRIDHVVGRHDFIRVDRCPTCESLI